MGSLGAALLPAKGGVLTHCNAGGLATGGYGTALGVIRAAVSSGKDIKVFADETRPWLQGPRLTAWELIKDSIPVTLIVDSAAGFMMQKGEIQAVVTGADRIAANGDVANKIGTYGLSVLSQAHDIPFYVAAPLSTIDLETPEGGDIPIEERSQDEVKSCFGKRFAPKKASARNFAFDITPSRFITAIITEKGVAKPPYKESLSGLFS
jgi:methylthioribose-1-phosphate isomerase